MSNAPNGQPPLDMKLFLENRPKIAAEELAKYAGKYVVYSGDGTGILASAETSEDLEKAVAAAGLDPSQVVFSYVMPPDVSLI